MNKNISQAALDAESAAKPTPIYEKRPVLVTLAIVLAALILFNAAVITVMAIRAAHSDGATDDIKDSFDYEQTDIKDYLAAFSSALVTGQTVAGKESKIGEIDDEYVKNYINSQLLSRRVPENSSKVNKTEPITYADDVYCYILYVEADGKRVTVDYFNNAYAQITSNLGVIKVGAATFGKAFDEALIGLVPRECGTVEFIEAGTVSATDVIVITYEATVDGEDEAYETVEGERWDMTEEAFAEHVVGKTVGEEFTFDVTHDIDDDGEDELVHYKAFVNAIAKEENVKVITATLPADYFGESMDEEYTSLNGKELSFHMIIDYSVAYEIAYEKTVDKQTVKTNVETFDKLTEEYIKDTLQFAFEQDPTDDADARAKYFAQVKKDLTDSREQNEKSSAINLIWRHLLDTVTFDSVPADAKAEMASELIEQFVSLYNSYVTSDSSFAGHFPTVEDYAVYYFGYAKDEYEGYEDYINNFGAERSVKQQLLIYAIYNNCGLNDEEAFKQKRAELIEDVIAQQKEAGYDVTEEDIVSYYGEGYIRQALISEMVNDYLYENNEIDWELSYEKQD